MFSYKVSSRSLQQTQECAEIPGGAWMAQIGLCTHHTHIRHIDVELWTPAHYSKDQVIPIACWQIV